MYLVRVMMAKAAVALSIRFCFVMTAVTIKSILSRSSAVGRPSYETHVQ